MFKKLLLTLMLSVFIIASSQAAIIIGNPSGDVTLTFIYDYQCLYCHHTYHALQKLMEEKPDIRIRLVPVPLLNPMSYQEMKLAITLAQTPYFNELNLILMNEIPKTPQELNTLLAQFDLDPSVIYHSNNQKVLSELKENINEFKQLKKERVPLILIHTSKSILAPIMLEGEQNEVTLKQAIDNAMAH